MARKFDEIEAELMSLSREDRARLIKDLIESLDADDENSQEKIDVAWKEELKRRLRD